MLDSLNIDGSDGVQKSSRSLHAFWHRQHDRRYWSIKKESESMEQRRWAYYIRAVDRRVFGVISCSLDGGFLHVWWDIY